MSEVLFVDKNSLEKIPSALKNIGLKKFAKEKVLVKLHMGEINNKWYVKPEIAKIAVDELKKIKSDPFLFDTPSIYRGSRDSKEKYMDVAKKHGFDRIGCEVVIGNEGKYVKAEGGGITFNFEIPDKMLKTKNMLVLSHVKGHELTGIGGAIKNLGMGGVSKATKGAMHTASVVRSIPFLSKRKITFARILALGAGTVLKDKNAFYMSVLLNITKYCDCCNTSLPIISKDVGFLFSTDPVAIDAASVDLIKKNAVLEKIFERDPFEHLNFAEDIGLGTTEYKLVKM